MKRFLECLIPVTSCDLDCSYCYVAQQNRFSNKVPPFKYSPEIIGKALCKDRLGGISFISLTGSGESLIPKQIPSIIYEILKQGHFVNLTTNGTLTARFEEIILICEGMLDRLHFSFSMHYKELVDKNKLDIFFKNIELIKKAGCSFFVQINLCDEYIEKLDEIKKISLDRLGALPQVAVTRDEQNAPIYKFFTKKSSEEYTLKGREFNSPLFEVTLNNFMEKRKEFCYAGEWSGKLKLGTGELTSCYGFGKMQNIFESIEKPIKFEAIGKNCPFSYCFNSSHFMSLGVIPDVDLPTYGELRNRPLAGWYNQRMLDFLNERLGDDNDEYSVCRKVYVNLKYKIMSIRSKTFSLVKKKLKKYIIKKMGSKI